MKKLTCVVAILAAASTVAVAKDLKQDKKDTAPTVAATQMTDAEMDKVTAGDPGFTTGLGATTASYLLGYNPISANSAGVPNHGTDTASSQVPNPGHLASGVCTAGVGACP
jgi:hypothetical protein